MIININDKLYLWWSQNKIDGDSYLEEKHKKFKLLKIDGEFKKIKEGQIYSQNETDDSDG